MHCLPAVSYPDSLPGFRPWQSVDFYLCRLVWSFPTIPTLPRGIGALFVSGVPSGLTVYEWPDCSVCCRCLVMSAVAVAVKKLLKCRLQLIGECLPCRCSSGHFHHGHVEFYILDKSIFALLSPSHPYWCTRIDGTSGKTASSGWFSGSTCQHVPFCIAPLSGKRTILSRQSIWTDAGFSSCFSLQGLHR